MITNRVCRALMIAAMTIISTTIAEAQRVNGHTLRELGQGSVGRAAATVPARAIESPVAMEPWTEQEAGPGGVLDVVAQQRAIVGSWLDTVTVTGGPTFDSLSTYAKDGSCVYDDQGSVITDPSFPHVFSAGHGVWVHRRGRIFSRTTLQLISDLDGNLLRRNKIRSTLTLNRSKDAYSAVWEAEFTDPAGNLVASFTGTTEGQRIRSEPLP